MSDDQPTDELPPEPETAELTRRFKQQAGDVAAAGYDPREIIIAMRAAARELAADGWEPDPVPPADPDRGETILADGCGPRARPDETVELRIRTDYGNLAGMIGMLGVGIHHGPGFGRGKEIQEQLLDELQRVCPPGPVLQEMSRISGGSEPVPSDGVDVDLRKLGDDAPEQDAGDDEEPGTEIPITDGGRIVTASDRIEEIAADLEADVADATLDAARELADDVEEAADTDRLPRMYAAGALYVEAVRGGYHVSQAEIAEAADIAVTSVRKGKREVLECNEDLLAADGAGEGWDPTERERVIWSDVDELGAQEDDRPAEEYDIGALRRAHLSLKDAQDALDDLDRLPTLDPTVTETDLVEFGDDLEDGIEHLAALLYAATDGEQGSPPAAVDGGDA